MVERSDGMAAVGGGRGTYSIGLAMMALSKPVLSLDLQASSSVDDGDGAVALHREMMLDPQRFFPTMYRDVVKGLGYSL